MAFDRTTVAVDLNAARELSCKFALEVRRHFKRRIMRLRLFGSAARGDWTSKSDIDVLVTLDQVRAVDVDWLSTQALRMGVMETGIVLQPVVMPDDRFRALIDRERGFAMDVEREGIDL